jgi:hypothetical protein
VTAAGGAGGAAFLPAAVFVAVPALAGAIGLAAAAPLAGA